jgi:type 1 fimbria pilin
MKRAVLAAFVLLFMAAAGWSDAVTAQKACARWVRIRFGVNVSSVTCEIHFEQAQCVVVTRTTPAATLHVDCIQEHLPGHFRCVLVPDAPPF